jgi:hypothetical protein
VKELLRERDDEAGYFEILSHGSVARVYLDQQIAQDNRLSVQQLELVKHVLTGRFSIHGHGVLLSFWWSSQPARAGEPRPLFQLN